MDTTTNYGRTRISGLVVAILATALSPVSLFGALGSTAASAAPVANPAVYRITDLGALGGGYAWAINDHGDVVGGLANGHGFRYRPAADPLATGTMTDLSDGAPLALSDDGTVFGSSLGTGPGGTARAVTPDGKTAAGASAYPSAGIIDPGYGSNVSVPGIWSQANGWNALYDDGCVFPGQKGGTAFAINPTGALAGMGLLGDANYPLSGVRGIAFKCVPDVAHPGSYKAYNLAPTGGPAAGAFAINAAGIVVGKAQTGETGPIEAYRWQGEGFFVDGRPLGTFAAGHLPGPGGSQSAAFGINDGGDIVGSYGPDASNPHLMVGNPRNRAFVYTSSTTGMQDLNDLVPSDSGWVLNNAFDVNNRGQIVGQGTHNGEMRAFLLTPRGDVNIIADRIVVTQVVQNEENLDLLVANKLTYAIVRAHTDTHNAANVTAVLHVYRDGAELGQQVPVTPHVTVVPNPSVDAAEQSFVFALPPVWTATPGDLTLRAQVNPDFHVLETSYTDDEPPPATVTLRDSSPVKVLVVDTYFARNPNLAANVDGFSRLRKRMKQMLPTGKLEITHSPTPMLIDEPPIPVNDTDNCGAVLGILQTKRAALGLDDQTLLYALIPPNPNGSQPYGSTTFGCAPVPAGLVETGWAGPGGEDTAVHEMVHTYGRDHTPFCHAEGSNTPGYPDANGMLSGGSDHAAGFHLAGDKDLGFDVQEEKFLPSGSTADIMTYCRPRWMSDDTYERLVPLIRTRATTPDAAPHPGVRADVVGSIDPVAGTADITAAVLEADAAVADPTPGPYHAEVYAGSTKLSDTAFAPAHVDREQAGDERPALAFALPVDLPAGADRIAIFSDEAGREIASVPISGGAPTIDVSAPSNGATLPSGGQLPVTWSASDPDHDPLTFTVKYRPSASSPWAILADGLTASTTTIDAATLTGSSDGTLRVVASDGFHIKSADVTGLRVPNKAPLVTIDQPIDNRVVTTDESVVLAGDVDGFDGPLPESAFEWTSDLDGVLGHGRAVVAQGLSVGTHDVELRVTGRGGLVGSAHVTVVVRAAGETPSELAVSQNDIVFRAGGGTPSAQDVEVYDRSGGAVPFTVTSDDPRVTTSAASGTTPTVLHISADTSDVRGGESFAGHVTVTPSSGAQSPVVIDVGAQSPFGDGSVAPAAIDFGRRAIGSSGAARTVTFTNRGRSSVRLGATSLAGAAPDQYARSADVCSNATLASGQSCTVDVSYTPDSPGRRPAYLVLANADASAHWYVSLTGLAAHHFTSSVVAWGNNDNGQLGAATSEICPETAYALERTCSSVPVTVSGLSDVVQVAVGEPDIGRYGGSHSLALKADGTVWAWGSNKLGELGNGTIDVLAGTSISDARPHPTPAPVVDLSGVTAIAAGYRTSLALRSDGTVWAWGGDALGNGTSQLSGRPVQVKGPNGVGFLTHIVAIAAGDRVSGIPIAYALKDDGTVWAWGGYDSGALGNDTSTGLTPSQVGGLSDVVAIGDRMALKRDGTVWTWGPQLGLGVYIYPRSYTSTPVQVMTNCFYSSAGPVVCNTPLTGITAIASDGGERFARDGNGGVWAWGEGPMPGDPWTSLGLATVSFYPIFAQRVLAPGGLGTISNVTMLSPGTAVTGDGSVWGWGFNGIGEAGVGNTTTEAAPRRVLGVGGTGDLSDVTQIAGGIDHRLAIVSASAGSATTLSAGAPVTVTAHAGDEIDAVVGAFDDSASSRAGDFSATIDWGDGTETFGVVTGPDGGPYEVHGTHTFTDTGAHDITIDVLGRTGASITLSGSGSIGAATLTGLPSQDANFVAGAFASAPVAAFGSSNPASTESSFSATVDWGDGSAAAAANVTGPPGGPFTVVGTHMYRRAGTYPLSVHVTDDHGANATLPGRAVVAPASLTAGDAFSVDLGTSTAFSGHLANFLDGNPLSIAGDYAARINWGDGTETAGVVSGPTGGPYTVDGTHTYPTAQPFSVTVTLTGPAGASATATTTLFAQRPSIDITSTVSPATGLVPLNSTLTYTVRNRGAARLWAVAVDSTTCGSATYAGAADANGSLDPGESWTFTCAHTFNTNGTFTDLGWASAYALTEGAPIRSTNASADVRVGDTTPPVVSVTGVSDGATYAAGAVPIAGCSTVDPAPSSGIATYATPTTTGGPTDFTVTCVGATDVAGNAGNTATARYTVRASTFTFTGFFPPVDNRPTVNSVKAGSAVPVKFSLGGDRGLSIFTVGYPKSQQTTCAAGASVDGIEQTANAGSSSLSYDAGAKTYNYVWKTDAAWKNTCRQLVFMFTDGTVARADFAFTK